MKRLMLAALLLLFGTTSWAADLTVQWTNPTEACDGTPIPPEDLAQVEIYIDTTSIPGPAPGTECNDPVTPPPAGFTPTVVAGTEETVTIQVAGGQTYYLRARVQHVNGQWSSLSNEAMKAVPLGLIKPPLVVTIDL